MPGRASFVLEVVVSVVRQALEELMDFGGAPDGGSVSQPNALGSAALLNPKPPGTEPNSEELVYVSRP